MSQRPAVIGMLICEQVIVEEHTRNVTLVNAFARRVVKRFPSDPFPFVVFTVLNDGIGKIRLDLRIQRLDTLEDVFVRSVSIHLADPLKEYRCLFRVEDCIFPLAGSYELALLADKEIIAQRRLHMTQKETPP